MERCPQGYRPSESPTNKSVKNHFKILNHGFLKQTPLYCCILSNCQFCMTLQFYRLTGKFSAKALHLLEVGQTYRWLFLFKIYICFIKKRKKMHLMCLHNRWTFCANELFMKSIDIYSKKFFVEKRVWPN